MGQLMNIVGPLLLLGGVIFVAAKRCELLGLCGETSPDSGDLDTTNMTGDEILDEVNAGNITPVPGGVKTGGTKGCCTCEMQGDRVKCHRGDSQWFNPPAGPDGSNDQSIELSLKECNKGCGVVREVNLWGRICCQFLFLLLDHHCSFLNLWCKV